jgi:predicted acylesterase/phospholipase RssA
MKPIESIESIESIENIVFSGGGIGGIAYIGVLKLLEELHLLPGITHYSGCSIGAIFATLISLNYTYQELKTLMVNFRYKEILDLQLLGLLENMGIETGKNIIELIQKLIWRKIGRMDLTFEEHWQITGRHLHINASCVETDGVEYFSKSTTPTMSVILAIRMSIAIPPVIAAVKFKGKTYVDGGIHDPFPIGIFDPEKTLGFRLANDTVSIDNLHPFVTHMSSIILSLYRRISYKTDSNYTIIDIKTGTSTLKINLSKADRLSAIERGYDSFRKELFKIRNNK